MVLVDQNDLGSGTSSVPFNQPLSGLTPGTTYYYCAIAANSVGTAFGAIVSFITAAPPAVTTTAATDITGSTTTLQLGGTFDGAIVDGRHVMAVRVYYEDTDFSGVVYHASYLRFMERGRTNHLRLMGASQHALFEQAQEETPGFAFVVRSMELDFLRPARMDDVLDVVTWPVAVKGASITLAQEVRRGDEVLVKAEVRVAFISEGRTKPIPRSLRLLMKADLAE